MWDTAIPQLDIAERISVVERGDITNYVSDDCSYCSVSEVRWRGVFEAVPRLMAFPVDYQWCLCGVVLKEKEGVIQTSGGEISYTKNGKWLYVETTVLGQNLNCELCISGIDYRGQELFTCIRIKKSGIDRQCKPCIKGGLKVPVKYLPVDFGAEKLKFFDHLK